MVGNSFWVVKLCLWHLCDSSKGGPRKIAAHRREFVNQWLGMRGEQQIQKQNWNILDNYFPDRNCRDFPTKTWESLKSLSTAVCGITKDKSPMQNSHRRLMNFDFLLKMEGKWLVDPSKMATKTFRKFGMWSTILLPIQLNPFHQGIPHSQPPVLHPM